MTTIEKEQLERNVKRQAKRLSKSLSVPLHEAQRLLAQAIYQCEDWTDLKKQLMANEIQSDNILLAGLHPNAETFLFNLVEIKLDELCARLSSVIPQKKENILIIILNIFAIQLTEFNKKIDKKR